MNQQMSRRRGVLTCQQERIDIFTVVAECHLFLAETDGVFACRHSIELLEVRLVDAAHWEVYIDGVCA